MRDSFIFYKSFYEAIRDLPRDIQGDVYTAIFEYSLYGKTTENLKPIARSIFALIQPQLDANNRKRDNGKKGAEYGKLGGRPPREENPEITPNEKLIIDNANVNDNVELIYNSYPSRCVVKGSSTGKTSKNKDKIKSLLKTIPADKLLSTITWYVNECKSTNTYMKNFSTFLNNLPDVSEDSLTGLYPQENIKPQGKIRQ